jgi:hypothetical protein
LRASIGINATKTSPALTDAAINHEIQAVRLGEYLQKTIVSGAEVTANDHGIGAGRRGLARTASTPPQKIPQGLPEVRAHSSLVV